MVASKSEASLDYSPNGGTGVFDAASLVLRLLPSKDGVVMRRLLMTVDGASLIRAAVSKEAIFFRQQLCRIVGDVLYWSLIETLGNDNNASKYSQVRFSSGDSIELGSSSRLSSPIYDYQSILRDKRLKVIFFKVLGSARKDPMLMMRLCWTSFVMFVTASALACHRVVVSLSEAYLGPISFAPKQFAVST